MGGFESFIGVDFWTALFVLLNTLAIFFVARKFLFKPVNKLINERKAEIDGMYSKAAELKNEAERLRDEYSQKLDSARNEADGIIKAAQNRAEARGEEIIRQAHTDAEKLIDRAEGEAQEEKARALNEAKGEIASLALSIAEKVMSESLNSENQAALVDEFIEKLGKDDE